MRSSLAAAVRAATAALALAAPSSLAPALAQEADPLAPYRGDYRPLLVFSPPADPRLMEQTDALDAARAGLIERDQVVLIAVGTGARTIEMRGGAVTQGAAPDNEALRARFGVAAEEFAVILVGKDGGEKLRTDEVLSPTRLFTTIDAMPMRRREMREGGAGTPDAGASDSSTAN